MNFFTFYFAFFSFLPTLLMCCVAIAFSYTILLPFARLRNKFSHNVAKLWGKYNTYILGIKIKKIDYHHFDKNKTYIIAVNHSTYIDPFLCLSILKGQYRIISEADMFRVMYIGGVMKAAGYIPVRMAGKTTDDVICKISRYLSNNISIVIFPEGRRVESEQLGKFRRGILRESEINPDIEILPMAICASTKLRKLKTYKNSARGTVYVKFLKPILLKDIDSDDDTKLEYLRKMLQEAYDDLKEKYHKT